MRNIIITRGLPASGKSTFLKEKKLEPWVISTDNLRLLFNSPTYLLNGKLDIKQDTTDEVFSLIYKMVERKMQNREFIILDATNIELDKYQTIKRLSEKYRYKVSILDFTDVPLDVCIERNKNRTFEVPKHTIMKMYSQLQEEKNQKIPSWLNVIKPENFEESLSVYIQDFSHWKKIHHIGDLHGCSTVLSDYLQGYLKEDELYIFVGDFLDRGIENLETLKMISRISTLPNVILIEGNHEIHFWNYANDLEVMSKEFMTNTLPQIEEFEKKNLRRLYRKLRPYVYYTYGDKTVLVSHGGLSFLPTEFFKISELQFINGMGDYSNDMGEYWDMLSPKNCYQVHGHRNSNNLPIMNNTRNFILEGQVEYGRDLRVLTLDQSGFKEHYTKNNVFHKVKASRVIDIDLSPEEYLEMLKSNELIKETKMNDISSFNFSREVFFDSIWNLQTIKARGLFINTKTCEIVARSYDKFFNLGEILENPCLIQNNGVNISLFEKVKYPITGYYKENGFLGITGYDSSTNKPIIASKSTTGGPYKEMFERLLVQTLGDRYDEFFKDLNKFNISAIFEVIDIKQDPHIIKYEESKIILLDLIFRNPIFEKMSYEDLVIFANKYNLEIKSKAFLLNNEEELKSFIEECKITDKRLEGYVLEDANGFMFKVKLPYYNFWKKIRTNLEHYSKALSLAKETDREVVFNFFKLKEKEKEIMHFIIENDLVFEDVITIQDKMYNK